MNENEWARSATRSPNSSEQVSQHPMRAVKASRAWIAGGAVLLVLSAALMYVLSLGPTTAIFRCARPTEGQPGECRLEESYVFWRAKAFSLPESAIRGAERINPVPGTGGFGGVPAQVGLRLASGQVVPVIGYDWSFVAETTIQRINVYLADRSASSLVIKPNCLTGLYLFCDIIAAIILLSALAIYLPRLRQVNDDQIQESFYKKAPGLKLAVNEREWGPPHSPGATRIGQPSHAGQRRRSSRSE